MDGLLKKHLSVMDPNIINFLYLNGVVVLILIAYMVWRPRRQPARLKLKEPHKALDSRSQPTSISSTQSAKDHIGTQDSYNNTPENTGKTERNLNIIFQYNGHSFDAYEVLGVAAGSSFSAVEGAYNQLIKTADKGSEDIYKFAYQAIKLTRSKSNGNPF